MKNFILWIICAYIICNNTYADNLLTLRSPDIHIAKQDIVLSADDIITRYTYKNESSSDITETLVLSAPANDLHTNRQTRILADNKLIEYSVLHRAISENGFDITNQLRSLGLSLDPIIAIQSIDTSPNRANIINKLHRMSAVDSQEELPTWRVQNFYYWSQLFKANTEVEIEYSYKPHITSQTIKVSGLRNLIKLPAKVAKKVWNAALHWSLNDNSAPKNLQAQLERYWPQIKEYCATLQDYTFLVEKFKKQPKNRSYLDIKQIEYLINNNESWANSIDNFNLIIKPTNDQYPMLCWNQAIERTNTNEIQFSANNYNPPEKLKVLYIHR